MGILPSKEFYQGYSNKNYSGNMLVETHQPIQGPASLISNR